MANINLISLKQIDPIALSGFISSIINSTAPTVVSDSIASGGYLGDSFVYASGGNQIISGQKTFASPPIIPYSTGTSNAASVQFVLDIVSENAFTGSGVTLDYLNSIGIVYTTGSQVISGNKSFSGDINVKLATSSGNPAQLFQLLSASGDLSSRIDNTNIRVTALENTSGIGGAGGFAGVSSINTQSGNIFIQGLGNVQVIQMGSVVYISGAGVTGISGIQGSMGPYLKYRGEWAEGNVYSYLDWVNLNGISWAALTGHLSNSSNIPGSNNYWGLLASGERGPSGESIVGEQGPQGDPGQDGESAILFRWVGEWGSGKAYSSGDAVYFSGSSYGMTGTGVASGLSDAPNIASGKWSLVVKAQPVDTSAFYPRYDNPEGYVVDTGQYLKIEDSGLFAPATHSHPYVLSLNSKIGNLNLLPEGNITISSSGSNIVIGSIGGSGGNASLSWRGAWSSSGTYYSGDLVSHNNAIYYYTGQSEANGAISNPLSLRGDWALFGERNITFNTGNYNPNKIYYKNDLVQYIGNSGAVVQYINTTSYDAPLLSLNPYSGIYNVFEGCNGNTGYNYFEIKQAVKNTSHPFYDIGDTGTILINDKYPNYNNSGYGVLTLIRGQTYYFDSEITGGLPLIISRNPSGGTYNDQFLHSTLSSGAKLNVGAGYSTFITGTAINSGVIRFSPSTSTLIPDTLYLQCPTRPYMGIELRLVRQNPYQPFISGAVGPSGKDGKDGNPGIAFAWKGNWSFTENYSPYQAVYYGGTSWGTLSYNNGVEPTEDSVAWFPLAKSGSQGPSGTSGKDGLAFHWKGTWNSTGIYGANDAVYYDGSSYATKILNSGLNPDSNPSVWFLVARQGATGPAGMGEPGLAFTWRGTWNSNSYYYSGDSVYFEGSSYATQQDVSGIDPSENPWFLVARKGGTIFSWRGEWNENSEYFAGDAVYHEGNSYATLSRSSGESPETGVHWFLTASKGADGGTGAPGPIGMNHRGAFNLTGIYSPRDAVYYNGNGYILGGTGSIAGIQPPLAPWQMYVQKGDAGLAFTWKGEYSPYTTYNAYDSVYYGGSSYATLETGGLSGVDPTGNSWFLVAKGVDGEPFRRDIFIKNPETGIIDEIILSGVHTLSGFGIGRWDNNSEGISGYIYRRNITNVITTVLPFTLNGSIIGRTSGFNEYINGYTRIGVYISGFHPGVSGVTISYWGQKYF